MEHCTTREEDVGSHLHITLQLEVVNTEHWTASSTLCTDSPVTAPSWPQPTRTFWDLYKAPVELPHLLSLTWSSAHSECKCMLSKGNTNPTLRPVLTSSCHILTEKLLVKELWCPILLPSPLAVHARWNNFQTHQTSLLSAFTTNTMGKIQTEETQGKHFYPFIDST